jgi:hypothetical protein
MRLIHSSFAHKEIMLDELNMMSCKMGRESAVQVKAKKAGQASVGARSEQKEQEDT